MELWFCLSEENKEKLAKVYENLTGRKFKPPERDKRVIHCETKLESLGEISKLMEQTPDYPLDMQRRK
jgi:hypothetical protein